ncbi:MAG: hypothetical protein M1478_05365 [Deltaproteobacteria bacterium]|nr:hypothetical protein [Deltaproteobacteria bacterium]
MREGGHWFYEVDACLKLRHELMTFKGGKIVLAIGLPHKCPFGHNSLPNYINYIKS